MDLHQAVTLKGLGLTPGTLKLVEQFTSRAIDEAEMAGSRFTPTDISEILSVAKGGVSNRQALDLIKRLCPQSKHDYVSAGMKPKNLAKVVPGVDIKVLGPLTLHQRAKVFRSFASKAPDEYWIAREALWDKRSLWRRLVALQDFAVRAGAPRARALFPRERRIACPPETRWLVRRMQHDRGEALLEFVRSCDHVLNNTSVVLFLTIGGKRLLFAGDAQLESWQYVNGPNDQPNAIFNEVAKTDLYKVSHHGSRNATPKTMLWGSFTKRGGPKKPHRITTVLSTAEGVQSSKTGGKGEVRRKTLVNALKAESKCFATNDRKWKEELCIEVPIELE